MKVKYGDKAKLLWTDTDGLFYYIETEDFYADTASDVEKWFDTSDIPKEHPAVEICKFLVGINRKIIGMFKDDCNGKEIMEFVGLRSKLYSYLLSDGSIQKCMGKSC